MGKKNQPQHYNSKDFFEIINTDPRPFILWNGGRVDLRFGIPKNALELYKSGRFKYFGLKNGAEQLFKNCTEDEILLFIDNATRKEDVEILSTLLQSEVAKDIVTKKILTFK